jgi:hypothetical protein
MTLLGKIFTMLIFIMALVWMAFAVAVYMTQKNWKDLVERPQAEVVPGKPLGLKHQLANQEAANKALRDDIDRLLKEKHQEQAARAHALAALEEMRQAEAALRKTAEEAQAQLLASNREATAAMAATQTRLDGLKDEIAQARLDIKTAQGDRDDKLQRVVALTDQLHQTEDARRRLTERQNELVAQIARMKKVLDSVGKTEYSDIDGIPPPVDGVVTAVRKEFMEISIGSDDGLEVGNELEVFRDRTYKGRIIVRRVDPDRAVAEINPDIRKGEIQPGDRVMTRSSVGTLSPTVR